MDSAFVDVETSYVISQSYTPVVWLKEIIQYYIFCKQNNKIHKCDKCHYLMKFKYVQLIDWLIDLAFSS